MKNIVFYDAQCPLCSSVKTLIGKLDWFQRIKWIPVQEIEQYDQYRFLQKRDVYDRIHMISSEGRLYAGIYTVRKLLSLLPVTLPIGGLLYLPLMDKVFGPLYMWVSTHRYKWFGRKESYSW